MLAKSLSYRCTADIVPLFKRVAKPSDFLPEFYFRLRTLSIHIFESTRSLVQCALSIIGFVDCTRSLIFCGLRLLHDHVNDARPVVSLISCAPQSLSSSAHAS